MPCVHAHRFGLAVWSIGSYILTATSIEHDRCNLLWSCGCCLYVRSRIRDGKFSTHVNFYINSGLDSPPLCRSAADKDNVFASQVQLSLSRMYSSVLHCSPVKPFGVRGQPKATGVMTELMAVANLVRGRDRCGAPELPRNGASGLPYSPESARLGSLLPSLAWQAGFLYPLPLLHLQIVTITTCAPTSSIILLD